MLLRGLDGDEPRARPADGFANARGILGVVFWSDIYGRTNWGLMSLAV